MEQPAVSNGPVSPAAVAEAAPPSPAPAIALPRLPVWGTAIVRVTYALVALGLFILALETLKAGAGGLTPILDRVSAQGGLNIFGFGWLGAYGVLSGSPVAAIALTLRGGDVLTDSETFAMINGSRYGASFIVLFVGFLYYLRHRRNPDGLYIGAVALLTTFTLYVPSMLLGLFLLDQGWLDGMSFGRPAFLKSLVDAVFDPAVSRASDHLPRLGLFALGVPVLLGSFHVFDRALPSLEPPSPRLERFLVFVQKPWTMFLVGLAVTTLTLSVSISLTLLVPLSLKGFLRRQNIIPYVMGANISTFGDTLFAATILDAPRAVTVVLVQMLSVAVVSLAVLALAYPAYRRAILGLAHASTRSRRGFATFLGAILFVPLVLLLV